QLVLTAFSKNRLLEVCVSTRVILAAHPDDFVTVATWHLYPKLTPLLNLAAFAVNVLELLKAHLAERVILMNENGQRIVANNMLHGENSLGLGRNDLFVFDRTAGVRQIDSPVQKC